MAFEPAKQKRVKRAKDVPPRMEGMEILHDARRMRDDDDGDEAYAYEAVGGEMGPDDVVPPGDGGDDAGNGDAGSGMSRFKKDRFLPISILVAAVVIGGSIVFATVYHGGAGAPNNGGVPGAAPTPGVTATSTAAIMQLGPRDAILGNANAPVTIVEYGDYQCPFCGEFFSQTEPSIIANYVNTGKAKMVFRNFAFLGPESIAAAEAAECAEDQNKLWAYHNALYSAKVGDDAKGGGENDGFFTRALFIQLAGQVGMNVSAFTSCIDSNKYATTVAQEKATATAQGVDSTPSFYVNGTPVIGAQPYSVFQQAIDAALAHA